MPLSCLKAKPARLAAVICGPAVVWFVVCAALELEMLSDPAAPFPETIMPIVLWAACPVGRHGLEHDEVAPAAEA